MYGKGYITKYMDANVKELLYGAEILFKLYTKI